MIYLELFLIFLGIGAFTFGGGYAMLPLIQDAVAAKGWLTEEELVNFMAVSESTPGPFAINMSTYVGMEVGGLPGAVIATTGVVLPSFIIILLVAKFFAKFKENFVVKGCMSGLKPAVIGMIGTAVLSTGMTVFFPAGFAFATFTTVSFLGALAIFGGSLIMALKKVHPIVIILISAVAGIAVGYIFGL